MNKKLLLALVSGLTALSVGVGATFALFSAQTSTPTNFVTGHICIRSERDAGDRVPGPMFYTTEETGRTYDGLRLGRYPTGYWVPGDMWERTLQIFNDAACSDVNVDLLSVRAHLTDLATLPAWIPITQQDVALADVMYVKVYLPANGGGREVVAQGFLSEFLAHDMPLHYSDMTVPLLERGDSYQAQFEISIDRNVGNSYRDMSLVVNFDVNARQH